MESLRFDTKNHGGHVEARTSGSGAVALWMLHGSHGDSRISEESDMRSSPESAIGDLE